MNIDIVPAVLHCNAYLYLRGFRAFGLDVTTVSLYIGDCALYAFVG